MMKKELSKIVTTIVLTMAVLLPAVITHAGTGTGTVTTSINQILTQAETNRQRSCEDNYVDIQAFSVYPYGIYNYDYFTYCRTRLYKANTNAQAISALTVIPEGQGYQHVYVYDAYAEFTQDFDICFASPTNDRAVVIYGYDER